MRGNALLVSGYQLCNNVLCCIKSDLHCLESVDRNLPGENFNFMEQSPKDLSDPTSSQLSMVERKETNHSLGVLLRKFLNENLPPKKKVSCEMMCLCDCLFAELIFFSISV